MGIGPLLLRVISSLRLMAPPSRNSGGNPLELLLGLGLLGFRVWGLGVWGLGVWG